MRRNNWLVGLLALSCWFFLNSPRAVGATVNAASCSQSAVQTAVNNATAGDIVSVQAGSCTWASPVKISGKSLTLQGAGIGQTNITASSSAFGITASATNFVTLSGFTVTGSTSGGVIQIDGTMFDVAFRVHDVRVVNANGRGIFVERVFGLIDHVTLDSSGSGTQSFTMQGSPDGNAAGTDPWTRPLALGTINAVYIEDSTVNWNAGADTVMDSYSGSRWVFRHNTVNMNTTGEGFGGSHGTDSGDRWGGTISFEIYSNTFTNTGGNTLRVGTFRGGTGVWYDNTYTGKFGGLTLMLYRACDSLDHGAWSQCTGTNYRIVSGAPSNFWKNTTSTGSGTFAFCSGNREKRCSSDSDCSGAGTCSTSFDGSGPGGYPCRNQPGIAPGQIVDPIYGWNNGSKTVGTYNGGSSCGAGIDTYMVSGRDYINNGTTPKPGYTPFVYPHPLQTGATDPQPPTGLNAIVH